MYELQTQALNDLVIPERPRSVAFVEYGMP